MRISSKSNSEDRSSWLSHGRRGEAGSGYGDYALVLESGSGLVGRALLRWWLSCHMICNLIVSCGVVIMDCSLVPWLWIAGVR